ncbi:DUF4102 domain-containing protein, partial [Erwinia billingiae]|uniref:DUF4102 domain-containing protein n=1 Tax=Erwinia billingiae TaxID=182337 RepID=UPI001A7E67B0
GRSEYPRGDYQLLITLKLQGKQRRIGIGRYQVVNLEDAIKKTSDLKAALTVGINPRHLPGESVYQKI